MYFVSFCVLAFCRSLSEKWRFWGKKRLKIRILRQWAWAHMPTTTLQANGLELSPIELERIEYSSHLRTRMHHRDIQAEWARADPAELAKMQNCTRTPIRPFLMPIAHVSLISVVGHAAFVFLVVSCKKGTLKRGRWVFLHSH
jgi:hypothetical protein